jgi:cysteinyl-tRNA synthetase
MSWRHLGESFDIHGGGDDLIFPHHENEIAQSCCAFPGSGFARVWVHNHMLLVNGEKMSKSLGNFRTIRDVLGLAEPEDVRFLLIRSHYRSTLDFSDAALLEARKELNRFYRAIEAHDGVAATEEIPAVILEPLCDDLNTPGAIAGLHGLADAAFAGDAASVGGMLAAGQLLGLFNQTPDERFRKGENVKINDLIRQRMTARREKNYKRADELRNELKALGVTVEDHSNGKTSYRYD